ncbi:hypothetical protein BDV96DRAFT_688106 [Lophiotrema nucula]|uniref:Uncharacterized protein n=1 Tax=Lophiotrema nucula TaxID=690887 RepID=A0A6A5Z8A2_9PLEO|nr:hypothetical protein BDV96DRAFT_688106 [Lophiotrema nucula]
MRVIQLRSMESRSAISRAVERERSLLTCAAPASDNLNFGRAVVDGFKLTHGFCGVFSTADAEDTSSALTEIAGKDQACFAAKNTCSRLGFENTSGIYVCASPDSDFSAPCLNVAQALRQTVLETCPGAVGGFSGQVFTAAGHNFIIAFANSNDPTNTKPSSYTPFGPNGDPLLKCKATITADGSMKCKTPL